MKNIFYFILFLFAISCIRETEKKNYTVINLNSECKKEFSDYFDLYSVIRLEKNSRCLINRISQIELYKNFLVILDQSSKQILIFDKNGKFVSRIREIGKGPGEFTGVASFTILNDSSILIHDSNVHKTMIFDFYGELKSEYKNDYHIHDCIYGDNYNYAYLGKLRSTNNGFYSLIKTIGRERTYFNEFDKRMEGYSYSFNVSNPYFQKNGGKTYFGEFGDQFIYELDSKGVKPRFFINVEPRISNEAIIDNWSQNNLFRFLKNQKVYSCMNYYKIFDNGVFISQLNAKFTPEYHYYDLGSNKCVQISSIDRKNVIDINLINSKDSFIYTYINPSFLMLNGKNSRLKDESDILYKFSNDIKPDDNPIIIIYEPLSE